jgi:hypothetical protein
MLGISDRTVGGVAPDQLLEVRLALGQGQAPKIAPIEMQDVECEIG